MNDELKRCPYCKELPDRERGGDDPFIFHGCKAGGNVTAVVERASRWQSRPIEDDLSAEIEKLRAVIDALKN